MLNIHDPQIAFLTAFLQEASELAVKIQKEQAGQKITKSDRSPVTVADFSIQALFAERLKQAFPSDVFIAEERARILEADPASLEKVQRYLRGKLSNDALPNLLELIDQGAGENVPETCWVLDPIDGTKGFLRGEQFAIAVAYLQKGKVELGALGCPWLDAECAPNPRGPGIKVIAKKGEGAWGSSLGGQPFLKKIQVSERQNISNSIPLGSVEPSHSNDAKLEELFQHFKIKSPAKKMDSQAKYAALAGGYGDFFMYFLPRSNPEHRMKIWDVAPGACVVEEAGGKMSDLNGEILDYSQGLTLRRNPGILASNGFLHDELVQFCKTRI